MEKTCFTLGKIGFWTHWKFCARCRIFDVGKAMNIYINYLTVYPTRKHAKWKHFKFTFINDFMMTSVLNFNVTRNDFGHVLTCWWTTIFLRVTYCGQVVEMNFSSINFNKLLKIASFPASWCMTYIMKMLSLWCITILGYTLQSRKFEKFINIYLNVKSLRRISVTPLFSYRKTSVLESLFNKVVDLQGCNVIKMRLQHRCSSVNIAKSFRAAILKIICGRLLLSLKGFCKGLVNINYENASFGILEYSIRLQLIHFYSCILAYKKSFSDRKEHLQNAS